MIHEVLAVHPDSIEIWDGKRTDEWLKPVCDVVQIGATDGTFRVGDRVTVHVRLLNEESEPEPESDAVPNEG